MREHAVHPVSDLNARERNTILVFAGSNVQTSKFRLLAAGYIKSNRGCNRRNGG